MSTFKPPCNSSSISPHHPSCQCILTIPCILVTQPPLHTLSTLVSIGPELDSDESTTSSEDNDEQQRQRNDLDIDLLDSHDHDIAVDDTTGLISGSSNAVSIGGLGGSRGSSGTYGNGTNREAFI